MPVSLVLTFIAVPLFQAFLADSFSLFPTFPADRFRLPSTFFSFHLFVSFSFLHFQTFKVLTGIAVSSSISRMLHISF